MALDRPRVMYRETHRQLGYRYFIMCQVLPLLVRLHHKTYETLRYNMDVTRLSNVMSVTA